MSKFYAIVDLDGYATQMRKVAAESISADTTEDLNDYITVTQITNLVKQHCAGFDDQNRPMLDEDANEEIFEATVMWIHNVGLAKLAGQNLIECAWDDKLNDMIFWSPKTEKKNVHTSNKRRKNKRTKGSDSGL